MEKDDRELTQLRAYISDSRWRFARTYVESYPHEYTLLQWGDADGFAHAIDCIERIGVVESFWGTERRYLYLDERKYWHMGKAGAEKPDERPTLINRTWVDVAKYADQARRLGYGDERLPGLVDRWRVLLEKARRRE